MFVAVQIKERAASAWCFTQFQMIRQEERQKQQLGKRWSADWVIRKGLEVLSVLVVVAAVVVILVVLVSQDAAG